CHYCAHRTEIGLEPACVVVCPEHAIIAGDMNDPTTEISRLIAQEKTAVRKPEQKTKPKLHYIDGHEPALRPLTTNEPQSSFVWADVLDHDMVGREPGPHAAEANDPVQFAEGTMAEQMVQVAYNAQHKIPWHWPVPAYMVTKGISAGIAMALGAGLMFDLFALTSGAKLVAGTVALVFLFLTTAFLVFDLAKPERFLYIIFKPQWKSWLTRGAYVLILFSLSLTAWTLRHFLIHFELVDPSFMSALEQPLLIAGAILGFFTAVYTAFLFAQAEGRDLWQAPLLWVHLAVQAVMLGSGVLLLMGWYEGSASDLATLGRQVFLGSLLINVLLNIFGEIGLRPHTEEAKRAAHIMRRGRYAPAFWLGGIVLGGILPALLVLGFSIFPEVIHGMVLTLGVLCSMIGLYAYEYAFVMAPQHVPNS
ncbi:MAG: polysulfide reductase NrfD, partial [Candidatus Eisenbacteria bacterium]|nr:polysulfide reductase NrfD [Candidatus Eisenbacteria bacterium]